LMAYNRCHVPRYHPRADARSRHRSFFLGRKIHQCRPANKPLGTAQLPNSLTAASTYPRKKSPGRLRNLPRLSLASGPDDWGIVSGPTLRTLGRCIAQGEAITPAYQILDAGVLGWSLAGGQ